MGIYVIGYKRNNSVNCVVRLFNERTGDTKDMNENDLVAKKNYIKMENARIRDNKLVGITGSLDKVLNECFFVVLGAYNIGSDDVKYKVVNTNGKVFIYSKENMIRLFSKAKVQNATLVQGKYIRGINWEIPEIENF